MDSKTLTAVADTAASNLKTLMRDMQEDILQACAAVLEDSQAGGAAKVKIGFGITLDLQKNKVNCKISISQKHSHDCNDDIPDPRQGILCDKDGQPVTKSDSNGDQFAEARNQVNQQVIKIIKSKK